MRCIRMHWDHDQCTELHWDEAICIMAVLMQMDDRDVLVMYSCNENDSSSKTN